MSVRVSLLESRKNVKCVGSHRFFRNSTACCLPQLASAAIAGSRLVHDARLSPTFYDERLAPLQLYDCAFHLPRLFLTNASTSSALRVLRISPASSHAFLAIPIPKCTLSSPAVECASGPIAIVNPSSFA